MESCSNLFRWRWWQPTNSEIENQWKTLLQHNIINPRLKCQFGKCQLLYLGSRQYLESNICCVSVWLRKDFFEELKVNNKSTMHQSEGTIAITCRGPITGINNIHKGATNTSLDKCRPTFNKCRPTFNKVLIKQLLQIQ